MINKVDSGWKGNISTEGSLNHVSWQLTQILDDSSEWHYQRMLNHYTWEKDVEKLRYINVTSEYIEVAWTKWQRQNCSSSENEKYWLINDKDPVNILDKYSLLTQVKVSKDDLKYYFTQELVEKFIKQNWDKFRIPNRSDWQNLIDAMPWTSEKHANLIKLFDFTPCSPNLISKIFIKDYWRSAVYFRTLSESMQDDNRKYFILVSFPWIIIINDDDNLDNYWMMLRCILK
ncbi:MAG: hypothetical protein ACD_4C00230G0002 [uncultured bacterium (gcode 4)]|uniref:Uncharacterized protein n=1 Tax=uncultured bacterium (gcode 4) TaxID=1234023 RepID=K2FXL6_9BACT|nr:MAG: hypothetical protein ACD_4C00230G0002 [uncultured bacterium (gcode 4)]